MKKIYALKINPVTVNGIKEAGYQVVPYSNLPEATSIEQDSILLIGAEAIPFDQLEEIRKVYDAEIVYWDADRGVNRWRTYYAKAQTIGVHYLANRATLDTILDKLHQLGNEREEHDNRIVGFFGTGFSAGTTSVSFQFAKRVAATGKKVIHLGLDLYDPGADEKTLISLDVLRPKLTAKIIQDHDFEQLKGKEELYSLPGNFDYLSVQEYMEEEIEYLLDRCLSYFDVVVGDFGSMCDSAAWYVGVQRAALRVLVGKSGHVNRLQHLDDLLKHLDLKLADFFYVANQIRSNEFVTGKDIAKKYDMQFLLEYPVMEDLTFSISKRDQDKLDETVNQFLLALGIVMDEPKKRRFF